MTLLSRVLGSQMTLLSGVLGSQMTRSSRVLGAQTISRSNHRRGATFTKRIIPPRYECHESLGLFEPRRPSDELVSRLLKLDVAGNRGGGEQKRIKRG